MQRSSSSLESQFASQLKIKQNKQPYFVEEYQKKKRAVVFDLITKDQCLDLYRCCWDFLEEVSPALDRDNPKTWTDTSWPVENNGVIDNYGLPHQSFVWQVRTLVYPVFTAILGKDLLCSFEGVRMVPPGRISTKTGLLRQSKKKCVKVPKAESLCGAITIPATEADYKQLCEETGGSVDLDLWHSSLDPPEFPFGFTFFVSMAPVASFNSFPQLSWKRMNLIAQKKGCYFGLENEPIASELPLTSSLVFPFRKKQVPCKQGSNGCYIWKCVVPDIKAKWPLDIETGAALSCGTN